MAKIEDLSKERDRVRSLEEQVRSLEAEKAWAQQELGEAKQAAAAAGDMEEVEQTLVRVNKSLEDKQAVGGTRRSAQPRSRRSPCLAFSAQEVDRLQQTVHSQCEERTTLLLELERLRDQFGVTDGGASSGGYPTGGAGTVAASECAEAPVAPSERGGRRDDAASRSVARSLSRGGSGGGGVEEGEGAGDVAWMRHKPGGGRGRGHGRRR